MTCIYEKMAVHEDLPKKKYRRVILKLKVRDTSLRHFILMVHQVKFRHLNLWGKLINLEMMLIGKLQYLG